MEVGLDEVVERERHEEEDTQEQVRMSMTMDGTKTHRRDLSHKCDVCASNDGARRAKNCALYTSVCFVVQLVTVRSRLLKLCVKMYAVFRSHCVS